MNTIIAQRKRIQFLSSNKFKTIFFVALLTLSSTTLAACSEPVRNITKSVVYENRLKVGDLTLGYPDAMHEADDLSENGAIPYSNTVLGGALKASTKAVSKQDVLYILSNVESDTTSTLTDVEKHCEMLADTVGKTMDTGYTRLSFSKERATVNGLECVIMNTVLSEPEQLGGSSARGIYYVLADENGIVVGQVEGYFYGDDYDEDPTLYDSIFASVQSAKQG